MKGFDLVNEWMLAMERHQDMLVEVLECVTVELNCWNCLVSPVLLRSCQSWLCLQNLTDPDLILELQHLVFKVTIL